MVSFLCFILGGFVGVAAMCMVTASRDFDKELYKRGYDKGYELGRAEGCEGMDCPAYERFLERGSDGLHQGKDTMPPCPVLRGARSEVLWGMRAP